MTPGARIAAVIDLVAAVTSTPRPADGTIASYLRGRRYIGSKDRREILETTWRVLRRRARLDWWLARAGAADDLLADPAKHARLLVVAEMIVGEGTHFDAVKDLFAADDKFGPGPFYPAERETGLALERGRLNHPDMPAWVRLEAPEWLMDTFAARFGDRLEAELAAMREEAATTLRANTLKTTREQAIAALEAEGVTAEPTALSPLGLVLDKRVNLPATQAFRDGLVEVQDEGSQLAALLVDAKPGRAVCDFCAGAGGKTLALAATMRNKGRLVACDVGEGRLKRMRTRLSRAGVDNVMPKVLSSETDKWVKRKAKSFDRVLIDAPCSGSGTWRRNPDAKWRLTPEGLDELRAKQAAILNSAARLVKPGGRLVYVTCSVLPAENEDQVEAFLSCHDEFHVKPIAGVWAAEFDTPPPTGEPWVRLTPARHGTDGFFVCVMERDKGADGQVRQEEA